MAKLRDYLDYVILTPYYVLKYVWIQIIIIASMFFSGAAIFAYYQGLAPLTALLASVSTITTIGLYSPNISTIPDLEKILLIVVIIISVGSAASLVQGTMSAAINKGVHAEILEQKKVERMRGHVILTGYKFLGKYVAEKLDSMGLEYIIIVNDESLQELIKKTGRVAICLPITHIYESLQKAGIDRASSLITTFDDDGDNMLVILSAKKLNKGIRTITVVNDRELVEGSTAAGADVVIPIYDLIGKVLASAVVPQDEKQGSSPPV